MQRVVIVQPDLSPVWSTDSIGWKHISRPRYRHIVCTGSRSYSIFMFEELVCHYITYNV